MVKCSFSVNTDVSEHNLVARRIVKDHMHHVGGLRGVVITKKTLELCPVWLPTLSCLPGGMETEKEKKEKWKKWYT